MSIINFWTNVTYNVGVSIYRKTQENTGQACNFIKKESLAQVFSCEFCEISKNTFFTEQLRTTASVFKSRKSKFWECLNSNF